MEGLELRPLSVSDIFDRCFTLIGRSWRQILATGAIILAPASIIFWLLFRRFFTTLGEFVVTLEETDIPDAAVMGDLFAAMGEVGIGTLVLFLAETLVMVGFALIYCGHTVGRFYEAGEVLSLTFSGRGARAVLQRFLGEMGCLMVFAVPYLMFIVVIGAEMGAVAILLAVCFLFLGFFFFLYLRIRWAFGLMTITWEDEHVMSSFSRSASLVSDSTARVFLLYALFSLIVSFAVSLVLTPVQFFVAWDIFAAYLDLFSNMDGGEPDMSGLFEAFTSMGPGFALMIGLTMLLTSALKVAYHTSIYFDLRARNGEFEAEEAVDPAGE